jgi:hypothetical protein
VSHLSTADLKDIGPGMIKIETFRSGRIYTGKPRVGITHVMNLTEPPPHSTPRSTTKHSMFTNIERLEPKNTTFVAVKTEQ